MLVGYDMEAPRGRQVGAEMRKTRRSERRGDRRDRSETAREKRGDEREKEVENEEPALTSARSGR